ncbi:MAG TPA: hypothetical protein VNP36_02560, partial [Burkholderiales bacterium]|nr:hypothetical protein [Burkholderiales bacterium]
GGVSASVGKRQGEAGAIVDGAVRDIDHSRKIGYPVWCSSVSPVTGKSRIRTVAIMSSLGRESYRASRLRFACAFLGDQTFDRIEDDGELLVVFLLESLDLAREMAVRIHQAP